MRAFLTAEWRYLAMLNYRIAPELLRPHVPEGTELDLWEAETYVSVVGFLFRNTRLLGIPIPWHRHFEELNLRFYVRRIEGNEVRRAVSFIRELVPRRAIAAVARRVYNEPYLALPMRHALGALRTPHDTPEFVEYGWRQPSGWGRLRVEPVGESVPSRAGSLEEFITEHYWGYTRQRDGGTVEYHVQHPRWRVWQVRATALEGPIEELYGADLGRVLRASPTSAFLAAGSPVTVYAPRRLSIAMQPLQRQDAP
jgi:uncharacterized protein YqjF (DUF2071 family)